MNIGDRIKSLRDERKMTQTELAELIGTTKQNIYKYENGIITNIPSDKIELIAKSFNVSPAYVMGWDDETIKTHEFLKTLQDPEHTSQQVKDQDKKIDRIIKAQKMIPIPLIGRCAAGLNCFAEDNITDYIQTDCDIIIDGYEHFWLKVIGESMSPMLLPDDLVLVRKQDVLKKPAMAVVRVDDEDGVVKMVDIKKDHITLTSINQYFPPRVFEKEDMNRIHLVGKVVEIKRRLE